MSLVTSNLNGRLSEIALAAIHLADAQLTDARIWAPDATDLQRDALVAAGAAEVLTGWMRPDGAIDIVVVLNGLPADTPAEACLSMLADAAPKRLVVQPNEVGRLGYGKLPERDSRDALSFPEWRSLCDALLGQADGWWLAAPAEGVALFPRPDFDSVQVAGPVHAAISGAATEPLRPASAVAWVGFWGLAPAGSAAVRLEQSIARSTETAIASPATLAGRQRRMAIVIDRPDWAFANIINNIAPLLEGRYQVSRFYVTDYEKPADLIAEVFCKNSFDNVHFMWRELFFSSLFTPMLRRVHELSGLKAEDLAERIAAPAISTSVYDHLFLRREDVASRRGGFAAVDAYAVSSARLYDEYSGLNLPAPASETPDAVSFGRFERARIAQQARGEQRKSLVVGWVGNSNWAKGNASLQEDPKGFHSILVPAVERLQAKGLPISLHVADRNIRHRDADEMVDYYGEIDVLVCSSSHEGTPNPVLEAMASGLPFVSTDVGLVREVSGESQHQFILSERNVDAMADALERLLESPETRDELACENLKHIEEWSWYSKLPDWLRLFSAAEKRHAEGGSHSRLALVQALLADSSAIIPQKDGRLEALTNRCEKLTEANGALRERLDKLRETNTWLMTIKAKFDELKASVADQPAVAAVAPAAPADPLPVVTQLPEAEVAALHDEIKRLHHMDEVARAEISRLRDLCDRLTHMDQAARVELDHRGQLLSNRMASLRHALTGKR
ncbi:MAG: glycosyltransferase [Paracoccus sp. (in: a-proteobacteria)]|uniref:glycosyltransferase family 4 protein n=1 Tax=Paracoccus sp. TaxID=267 RepID=UPI0026DEF141|nr:glycosyltransferase [Paracoccus sp. (in: a-proteobacteria)]MDO5620273.1 glycosyltransferase [Paracoccus sp. (in: a-proteobacteria)]